MKTLLVMRHAKSAYPPDIADDFHRPLNKRGRMDAPRMAALLGSIGMRPQVVVSSPAVRAAETASATAAALELGAGQVLYDERLYLASPASLSRVASEAADAVTVQMVIAHNPGVEEWLGTLCGANARMPTAALAALELDLTTWMDLRKGHGRLQWLIIPRMLRMEA